MADTRNRRPQAQKRTQTTRPAGRSGPQNRQGGARGKAAPKPSSEQLARLQRQRRNRILLSSGIVVIVVVIVAIGLGSKPSSNPGASPRQKAPSSLVSLVEGVPASVLNQVGAGAANTPPTKISPPKLLSSGGKPQIVYVGAEYCPHCGAERWAMVNALSRFGTFSNLQVTHSAASDGDVATFSFYGSSYSSPYIVFTPTETYTNQTSGSFYKALQPMTALDNQLVNAYDSTNGGAIPFSVFGGLYYESGVEFNDEFMMNSGLSWDQIAQGMQNPTNELAQAIDGSANLMTATICQMTNQKPGDVCNLPGVVAAAKTLPK